MERHRPAIISADCLPFRCSCLLYTSQHIQAEPLEIGREEAIRLGKQYVHNDICFPCQIVIGEALAALKLSLIHIFSKAASSGGSRLSLF